MSKSVLTMKELRMAHYKCSNGVLSDCKWITGQNVGLIHATFAGLLVCLVNHIG